MRREWLPMLSLAALVASAAGGLAASVTQARPVATHAVRLASGGYVEFVALLTDAGIEQVAPTATHVVPSGTTVVLAVRAGHDGAAWCRILVDGATADEQSARGGDSVTCSWTV